MLKLAEAEEHVLVCCDLSDDDDGREDIVEIARVLFGTQ